VSREFLILCGGTKPDAKARAWRKAAKVVLDDPLEGKQVRLKVTDITGRLTSDLPDAIADVLELATYVYCADQAAGRGGKSEFEYGSKWRRRFRFEVPVRQPELWTAVSADLARTLGFLSDDDYEFRFVKHPRPPAFSEYLPKVSAKDAGYEMDSVVMFSGGLDSLAGAVQEVLGCGHRVALVSHRPVSKLDSRQRELAERLSAKVTDRRLRPFQLGIWANKRKQLSRDYTQRTRSFLFGSFGLAVATLFGLNEVKFYENGVVSLNLPVCAQVLGGRASRTTHPQALWRMQSLFSRLRDEPFRILNPFLWKTKTEVTLDVLNAGCGDLIRHTVSCAHTWETTTEQPHCGKCSQCIDRKLATLGARLTDAEDPDSGYRVPVLTGAFAGVEHQTMVERVLGTAHHVAELKEPTRFFAEYGEASRVLRYLDMPTEDAAAKVFTLYRRQAIQVLGAVQHGVRELPAAAPVKGLASIVPESTNSMAAATPAVRDGGSAPADFVPDDADIAILRALFKRVVATHKLSIATYPRLSRNTVGHRITKMLRYRLVRFPNGPRGGVVITPDGRALLASVDAQQRSDAASATVH